ncbi:MAG: glycosyltransferase family 9 protein [bacterium]|nr:glycosyltransferase family 9 protein [bacterium]
MNLKIKQWIDGYIGKAIVAVNLVFVRGLGLLLRRDHSLKKAPDHILVIKILGLGSVLMAADSIYSLRKRYPQAKIILFCGKGIYTGVAPLNLFDEIWVNDDSSLLSMVSSGFTTLFKAISLRNLWVLDLEVYSVLTTIFSSWTMARNRFGFQLNKVHFRNYLNTHNTFFNQFITVTENYENLVKSMGVETIEPYILEIGQLNRPELEKIIAINNTCSELGGDLRKMPDALLVQTVNYLLNNSPYTLVLTGAPSDFLGNEAFLKANGLYTHLRVRNIAGKYSFSEYYSLLKHQCGAMISIDSAPFHMAVKAGIPTLSFWGPINPIQRFRFDLNQTHEAIYLQTPCSPCIHLSDVVPCGGDNICMKQLTIALAEPKLQSLLKKIKHE